MPGAANAMMRSAAQGGGEPVVGKALIGGSTRGGSNYAATSVYGVSLASGASLTNPYGYTTSIADAASQYVGSAFPAGTLSDLRVKCRFNSSDQAFYNDVYINGVPAVSVELPAFSGLAEFKNSTVLPIADGDTLAHIAFRRDVAPTAGILDGVVLSSAFTGSTIQTTILSTTRKIGLAAANAVYYFRINGVLEQLTSASIGGDPDRIAVMLTDSGTLSRFSIGVAANTRPTNSLGNVTFDLFKNGVIVDTLVITRAMGLGVHTSPNVIPYSDGDRVHVRVTMGNTSSGTFSLCTASLCVQTAGVAASPLVAAGLQTTNGAGAPLFGGAGYNFGLTAVGVPDGSMSLGFDARLSRFRGYIHTNTATEPAELVLVQNGVDVPLGEIPAAPYVGWFDFSTQVEVSALDELVYKCIRTGGTGSQTIMNFQARCQYLSG